MKRLLGVLKTYCQLLWDPPPGVTATQLSYTPKPFLLWESTSRKAKYKKSNSTSSPFSLESPMRAFYFQKYPLGSLHYLFSNVKTFMMILNNLCRNSQFHRPTFLFSAILLKFDALILCCFGYLPKKIHRFEMYHEMCVSDKF